MNFDHFDSIITFAYEHPAYAWVIGSIILFLLGLMIKPVRKWFMIPAIAFFVTGVLLFLDVVAPEAYLIQGLCVVSFLAVVIACYE